MKLGKKGIALCNKIEVLKSEKLPRKTLDIWAVIWNKKNIITEFKRVKKRRGPLHSAYMQKNYGPLFHAILHQYGTYCNFIKIMGLDYEAIKREGKVRTIEAHQKYSRESLLQQGVDWYKKGVHLAPMKIRELNSEVYHSITNEKYFGSWEKYILALRVCLKKLGHANFELLRYRSLWSRKL